MELVDLFKKDPNQKVSYSTVLLNTLNNLIHMVLQNVQMNTHSVRIGNPQVRILSSTSEDDDKLFTWQVVFGGPLSPYLSDALLRLRYLVEKLHWTSTDWNSFITKAFKDNKLEVSADKNELPNNMLIKNPSIHMTDPSFYFPALANKKNNGGRPLMAQDYLVLSINFDVVPKAKPLSTKEASSNAQSNK